MAQLDSLVFILNKTTIDLLKKEDFGPILQESKKSLYFNYQYSSLCLVSILNECQSLKTIDLSEASLLSIPDSFSLYPGTKAVKWQLPPFFHFLVKEATISSILRKVDGLETFSLDIPPLTENDILELKTLHNLSCFKSLKTYTLKATAAFLTEIGLTLLEEMINQISSLPSLETFKLQFEEPELSSLEVLKENLANFSTLKHLSLRFSFDYYVGNKPKELPLQIPFNSLSNLITFCLITDSYNLLTKESAITLLENIKDLKNLERFSIRGNGLRSLENELFENLTKPIRKMKNFKEFEIEHANRIMKKSEEGIKIIDKNARF